MVKNKTKTPAQKRKRRNNIIISLIFLIGLAVMSYPLVSNLYYQADANNQIADFDNEKDKIDSAEIDRRYNLARAYNDSLNNNVDKDPYSDEMLQQGRAEYARMLELHEKIGYIEIPKISVKVPIYAGTSEEVLQMGSGHLEGTSLPIGGNSTHSVLTAHTGLPTAKLFTELTQLKVGDKFYVHNLKEVMAYQVDQIKVVEPTNFEDLLIVPGHDYVSLLTCTPYMINTHRLLVRGHRVPYVKEVDEKFIAESKLNYLYRNLFYISLVLILILIFLLYRLYRKKKKSEKRLEQIKAESMTQNALEEEISDETDRKEKR